MEESSEHKTIDADPGNTKQDGYGETDESMDEEMLYNENSEEALKTDALETQEPAIELPLKGPPVNCMEKIVFFVDISSEMGNVSFNQSRTRNPTTFLQYFQRTMQIFLATKKILNPLHEYALALLQDETVFWCQEFTDDARLVAEIISELEAAQATADENDGVFSFDHVLDILKEHCELPIVPDVIIPPPYVVRCILVYGRSKCPISISTEGQQILEDLKKSPYFFLDILYMHDPPSSENKSKEIYDFFCELDKEELGYVLEVSHNIQRLFEDMAKLLSHPLQRCKQNEAFYDLMPPTHINTLNEL